MLTNNTMRFGTDNFSPFLKEALLIANQPLDASNCNVIESFNVEYTMPAGSDIRFMFKADNKIYKFSGQNLVEFSDELNLENVLDYGNTVAQILAVSNNKALAGKNIYPVIALTAENEAVPTVKLSINAAQVEEVLERVKESAKISFDSPIKLIGHDLTYVSEGNGSAFAKIKLKQDGVWADDYIDLDKIYGKVVDGYRIEFHQLVTTIGGSDMVDDVAVFITRTPDVDAKIIGDQADLYSIVRNYRRPLKSCVLIVRHSELDGGEISAAVNFNRNALAVSNLSIGIGTGASQKIILNQPHFFYNTLKIYIDGVRTTDFTFDTADNSITLTAPQGAAISATFDYKAEPEEWIEMTADAPQPTRDGSYTTRFYCDNDADEGDTVSNIRLTLKRNRGTTTKTYTATGAQQILELPHNVTNVNCETTEHAPVEYDYDDETQTLTWTAEAGTKIEVSYEWYGNSPIIYGFAASWAPERG